jgi:hypothetical protein
MPILYTYHQLIGWQIAVLGLKSQSAQVMSY